MPWWVAFYAMFPSHYGISELRGLRCNMEEMEGQDVFSVAFPTTSSALASPWIPARPLTHTIWAVRPSSMIINATIFWLLLARLWLGSAPECPTRAITLVEPEWIAICLYRRFVWYYVSVAPVASASASYDVRQDPRVFCAV